MARLEIQAKTPLGTRLREIRKVFGDPDRGNFAQQLRISKSGLAHYERGERSPDAVVLASYHTIFGIDINWLLTGKGQMLPQSATQNGFIGSAVFDKKRFLAAIEAVEEGLQRADHSFSPERKAELCLAAYELMESDDKKNHIAKLIRTL